MKGLQLDMVWWLVTPQNPLKALKPMGMEERISHSKALLKGDPNIVVSDIERDLGTNITYHSIKALKKRHSKTRFVWISGMDNALSLHTWNHWQELLQEIPMVHLTRQPATSLIQRCPLRMYARQKHVYINKSARYALNPSTTYWMMQKKMIDISSSQIRSKTA